MKLKKWHVLIPGLAAGMFAVHAQAQPDYGPDGCKTGYVWREAFPGDHVCVIPQRRAEAASDNSQADARRSPGGGDYGPDTCRSGYVWREAGPDDHVCVTPDIRAQAAADNRMAARRIANRDPGAPGAERDSRPRACTIYEDRDYGGAHLTLRNGDDLKMVSQPDVGKSDGIHRFRYEENWNDSVSSFKVDPGCTLTLWEHVDYGGTHFRANRSYKYVGDGWNDKASEAVCDCGGLPKL